ADAFGEAARHGDLATVRRLLDDGVDVNTKFRYNATALAYACDRGYLDIVQLLLDRGADVNATDTFYKPTPLVSASEPSSARKPQHAEVVRLLLQHGAKGIDDALTSAAHAGDRAMTAVILEFSGITPEALSDALEVVPADSQKDLAVLLMKAGAKPRV